VTEKNRWGRGLPATAASTVPTMQRKTKSAPWVRARFPKTEGRA
jgi:hypothetical protein